MTQMSKLQAYIDLTRINRPIGIYLVLWPALWALWIAAEGVPDVWILGVFVAGAVLMRSAGCVINDYADRNFDGQVTRTCCRPLATGALTAKEALVFFAILCLISFSLVLTLNWQTIALSLGALLLAALYPFMKRHTHWPQAFLGAAFAWAIPMGFAAVTGEVPAGAWLVFAATMVWSLIYDTAYAVGDLPDDLKAGIKSTAILFGDKIVAWIAFFQLVMLSLLIAMGWAFELQAPYYLSLLVVGWWFARDLEKIATGCPKNAFKVFLDNHWIGVIVLLGIVASYAR